MNTFWTLSWGYFFYDSLTENDIGPLITQVATHLLAPPHMQPSIMTCEGKKEKKKEREMETHLLGIHKYIHFLWGVNGWPNIEWSHHGCHHEASYHWPSDAQSNFQEFCVCKVKRSISWDFCLQSWRANWLNAIAYHTNNLLHSAHTYTQTHTSLKYSDAQLKKIIK